MAHAGILQEIGHEAGAAVEPGSLGKVWDDHVNDRVSKLEEAVGNMVKTHTTGEVADARWKVLQVELEEAEDKVAKTQDSEVSEARKAMTQRALQLKSSVSGMAIWAFGGLGVVALVGFGLGYGKMKALEKRFAGGGGLLSPRASNKLI